MRIRPVMNPASRRDYAGSDKPHRQKKKKEKYRKLYYIRRFNMLHYLPLTVNVD